MKILLSILAILLLPNPFWYPFFVYLMYRILKWWAQQIKDILRNPLFCPHNIIDTEDGEDYCVECGIVLVEPTESEL